MQLLVNMLFSFPFRNKKINLNVVKVSFLGKIIGLMFSRREKANNLLFEFEKPTRIKIHSFFVFYDFLAVWFNEKGKIVEKKIIKPFSLGFSPSKKFVKLVEIPINKRNLKVVKTLVGKNLKIRR